MTTKTAEGGDRDREAAIEGVKKVLVEKGIEFLLGVWVDTFGRAKAKFVPIEGAEKLLAGDGPLYGVHALEAMGNYGPADPDQSVLPDLDSLLVCPWDPRVAWFSSDIIWRDKTPYPVCSRTVLKRQIARAADLGLQLKVGIEPEFYLFQEDQDGKLAPFSTTDSGATVAYDVGATFAAMPFMSDLVEAFHALDWPVGCFVHEGGHGQYEFDYGFDDALVTADHWIFIKEMVRRIAVKHDAVVTFMPKPFDDSMRSGAHYNMSLWDIAAATNVFEDHNDPRGLGLSQLAYQFVAGQLAHAKAITAVTCQTVNSYRGLTDASGIAGLADENSWAPVGITYGVNNRSAMMRLPDGRACVESRATDSSCNIYLGLAMSLAAGLDGIERGLDPGDPITERLYGMTPERRTALGFERLPGTLGEAIDAFEADEIVADVFGTELRQEYLNAKRGEWQASLLHTPQWDRDRYFNLG